jgi:tRNA(fMet)-specific endonuclease VapC
LKPYLLDTNVCVDVMRDAKGSVAKVLWSKTLEGHKILISIITRLELQAGALASTNPQKGLNLIEQFLDGGVETLDFGNPEMIAMGLLVQRLREKGQQLQAYDALIAGHAFALGATLVTSDARLAAAVGEVEVVSWR